MSRDRMMKKEKNEITNFENVCPIILHWLIGGLKKDVAILILILYMPLLDTSHSIVTKKKISLISKEPIMRLLHNISMDPSLWWQTTFTVLFIMALFLFPLQCVDNIVSICVLFRMMFFSILGLVHLRLFFLSFSLTWLSSLEYVETCARSVSRLM